MSGFALKFTVVRSPRDPYEYVCRNPCTFDDSTSLFSARRPRGRGGRFRQADRFDGSATARPSASSRRKNLPSRPFPLLTIGKNGTILSIVY